MMELPSKTSARLKWVEIIRFSRNEPKWQPCRTSVVCSDHFDPNDLYITNSGYRRVVKTGIPKRMLTLEDFLTNTTEALSRTSSVPSDTDNDSRDIDESVEPIVSMQDNTAEQNESSNASHVDDSNVKEEVSSKTTSKDPGKCLCGSVLDTMMKHKWEKDEIAYKTRILMKNKKINNLQKINARLHKKNTIVKNMLKMLKRNKYVDPLVLREISFHVTEDRPDQDLLDIKEEEIEDNELSPTREAEKDSLQVNEHNFMEDSIPIKLEVIDDSENDIEAGNSFYAENTAGNQQENVFTPQTILSTQNMITIDLPPIDGAMEADNQTNILYKSTNVLDEYDKWALKIANQIKIMTNVEEKVNLLNATQSLVDAFLAKDANTSLKTAHSKSDEAVFQSFVKPNKKIFVPSMLPVMGGILIPQQGTSNEEMSPQAVQIEPTMLSNLIQAQKQNE
ncbi:uncharacterized protein [Epargyreus clarus]|uniref:uncharacterized protein isoform X4 n=1 Tax=Epargyreus clarus TaxID=520877 RepID=UPI003C2F55FF